MNNRFVSRLSLRGLFFMLTALLAFVGPAAHADTAAPTLNDSSYYEISSAEELQWFANKVNGGSQSINGVLTADINLADLSGDYWEPIGAYNESTLTIRPFKGKFDGQGHVVYGLVLRKAAASGLFGYVEGATISNVTVQGAKMKATRGSEVSATQYGIAAICGLAISSTQIKNCHALNTEINYYVDDSNANKDINCVGGIAGELRNSRASGCTVSGFVHTEGMHVGGIVGFLNAGQVDSCQFVAYDGGYSKVVGTNRVGGIVGYLQNRTVANAIRNCSVAEGSEISSEGTKGTVCGLDTLVAEPSEWNGYYEIYTPDQLKGFASLVNGGKTSIKGRLMNNLQMKDAGSFTPIGTEDKNFSGVFDGQDFTIDSLTIKAQEYAGLFGYVKDGSIKNIVFTNPTLITNDCDYQGIVAGFLTQNSGHSTPVGYIENCKVTNGVVWRNKTDEEADYIGGIVGKFDMSAEVRDCSYQGAVKSHRNYVGGIAGCMDSGAKMYRCTTIGETYVSGNNYIGGVVGYMTDNTTHIYDCDVDQTAGNVTAHAEPDNNSGLIRGYDDTESEKVKYNEGNLQYEFTGKKITVNGKQASEMHITSTATEGQGTYYAIVDIGTYNNYFTTEIEKLSGVSELYFWDNCSNIAGTEACGWINMKIRDRAFDSNFKKLYMRIKMFAGDDHDVMLRPSDVRPAGDNMFANCPDARVYVDAEYYDEFLADSVWGKYKQYIVPTTSMRTEDVNAEHGARYAYDRNRDRTGSVVKQGNVSQVHVIGIDNSFVDDADNDQTLWIYQDIGETYDFNTTKIWASSFSGKSNVKNVKLQAITKSGSRPSQAFCIAIGDSAFARCQNLASFEVALYSDEGKDHVEVLHPSQMPIGRGVFADCPNVKIYVDPSVLLEFRNDTTYGWAAYKDLIAASTSAWDEYEEDGVKYGHVTSADGQTRYTSKNRTEMEEYVKSWVGQYANFTTKSVLCPDYDGEMNYMIATGVNTTDSNIEGGTLKIYNDIGNTYDYKTIALSATGFRGNQQIQKIIFEDCAGSSGNANVGLSLVIPDGTFEGCSNLKELNMFQYITKGSNHYESIKPSQIFIGKDVFKGVHPDFRIKVIPALYDDFINDANWSQYKDLITATDYVPTGEDDVEKDGVTYSYASNTLNTIPTSETIELQSSLWNIPIIIGETVMIAQDIHSLLNLMGYRVEEAAAKKAYTFASTKAKNMHNAFRNEIMKALDFRAVGEQALYEAQRDIVYAAEQSLGLKYTIYSGAGQFEYDAVVNWSYYMEEVVETKTALVSAMKNTFKASLGFWGSLAATGMGEGVSIATQMANNRQLQNAVSYLTNRASKQFEKKTSWYINAANWVTERVRNNVPQMYVKDVNDQQTVNIYVNPGTSNHWDQLDYQAYQTMEIGRTAFHGKKNVSEVQFTDATGNNLPLEAMTMVIPDSCFTTCSGLTKLNLVLNCEGAAWGYPAACKKALTPDNFILSGDIFAGCDTTKIRIYVGEDVLQDFLDDDFWGRYKSMYRTVHIDEVESNEEWSCRYTYTYDNNTMPLVTETSAGEDLYHVDIYAPDNDDLQSNNGLAALINDYGLAYNYKLDNVRPNAFKNNSYLRTLDVTDSHSNIGDVYSAFSVYVGDSAFAHCPNFQDLNLVYQVTDGTNCTQTFSPKQMTLGRGVFDDCPNLRIKVCLDQADAFLTDLSWMRYRHMIKPCFFDPKDSRVFDLLKDKYLFQTELNGNESWNHIDALRAKPSELKTLFKGTDIASFDEFPAFGSCGLKTVYEGMFQGCQQLQSIVLPDSITSIGANAFTNCSLLTSLSLPASVDSIGENAFSGSALRSIIVNNPKPADIDAAKVFNGLLSSKDYVIYVPDTVVDLYRTKWAAVADHINAASQHRTLTVVTVTGVGQLAGRLGLNVQDSKVSGNVAQYDSLRVYGPLGGEDILVLRALGGRNIDNEKNGVGHLRYLDLYEAQLKESDFVYNRQPVDNRWDEMTTNCTIDGDGYVDRFMFSGMTDLVTLILPKTTTHIYTRAFDTCPKLQTLVVGDNTSSVAANAAMDCPNMEYLIMLPEAVPETDYTSWAFHAQASLNRTNLTGGTTLSDYTRIQMIAPPTAYGDYFKSTAYTTYTADSISTLFADPEVFAAMKKAHIFSPADLCALRDMHGLVSGNTAIQVFNELLITAVDTLDAGTLTGMSRMQEVSLPLSLSHIKADAFSGCTSLKNVYAFADACPTLAPKAFDALPTDFVITVAEGEEDKYRAAWPEYANHIKAYSPALNIREVTLEKMNTLADSLGLKVWMDGNRVSGVTGNISAITALKVNGPVGSKDIAVMRMLAGREPDNGSLAYAANLKYLNLYDADICKDDVKFASGCTIEAANEIPEECFNECYHPETLILPKSVTKINDDAFYDMYSLKTLVLGDRLNDVDGNDAFGECNNLNTMVFLCDRKPELNHDAFSDPVMFYNDVYKVNNMYVRKDIIDDYTNDTQYTSHANHITSVFSNDDLFRAYGSRGVATEEDLSSISAITGWFKGYDKITDLSSLKRSTITEFSADNVANLSSLQRVSLPSTIKTISDSTFASNEQLAWVDLSLCDSLSGGISNLGLTRTALLYAPAATSADSESTPAYTQRKARRLAAASQTFGGTNVVYSENGHLVCDDYFLTADRDYDVPRAFTARKVTFSREFTPQTYTSISLPFALSHSPSGFKFFRLNTTSENAVALRRAYATEANTPYLLWAENAEMVVDAETNVTATSTPQAVRNLGYTLSAALSAVSTTDAKATKCLVFDTATTLWNLLPDTDSTSVVKPFTAYVQVNNTSASTVDVPTTFLDPLYFYHVGTARHMLDGDAVDIPLTTDRLALTDGLSFAADTTFTAAATEYSRTMSTTWGTLCLPHPIEAEGNETCEFYELSGISSQQVVLSKLSGTIAAGRPVLVRRRAAGTPVEICATDSVEVIKGTLEDGTLTGTFTQTVVPSGSYIISKDKFWLVSGSQKAMVGAFRAYINASATSQSVASLSITTDDAVTAIEQLNAVDDANAQYYDAQGRRHATLQRGINIVKNGERAVKVIIK